MDCFHWDNPTRVGDDYFFSVMTSTEPGYFLPEQIAAGRVAVEDLIFNYSIPRCANPEAVFSRILAAAGYAQKRLGGTLGTEDGLPLDEAETRGEIRAVVAELAEAGFPPGSAHALQQF